MDSEIDLRTAFGLLRRQLRIIIATVVLIMAIAITAIWLAVPIYTATTLVMVDPSHKNLLTPDTDYGSAISDNARVDGEVELARSDNVLLAVIAEQNLVDNPEFRRSPGILSGLLSWLGFAEAEPQSQDAAFRQALKSLSSRVSVQRRGDTYLLSISAQSADPAMAARLANAIAGAYIEGQVASKIENTLRARDVLQARIAVARQSVTEAEEILRLARLDNPRTPQLRDLHQTAVLARRQYDALISRAQDLDAQADLQLADSSVVSAALRPAEPTHPNPRLILTFAGIAALGIGVGVAFLYEHYIGGVTSEAQLATIFKSPVALAVPRQKLIDPEQRSLSDKLVVGPLSIYAEAIRRIRAAIDQAIRRGDPDKKLGRVIMVTSTAADEGKTTIALSLARSYALSGRRTLILDCDLRNPAVHHHLDFEPVIGLLSLLTNPDHQTDLERAFLTEEQTGLTALLGAQRSDMPTDQLIASRPFEELIETARASFDIIVLDTPPLAAVVDGLYLAAYASAITFVVRWSATAQTDIRKALVTLERSITPGTEIIPVLNRQDVAKGAEYKAYMRDYPTLD